MRITLLLIFISVFSMKAAEVHSQSALVTLSTTNSSIESILDEIEAQTGYLFIVNSSVDTNKKVSIKVKDTPVSSVLNDLLKGSNVSYAMEGSYIMLSKNKQSLEAKSVKQDQDFIVKGKITDASGEALLGVNILFKGTSTGTISDLDGNYSLKVPNGKGELQFSYIGFQNLIIPINNKNVINVTMKEDSKLLGEVVVTAMGIERKAESLTYATQTVGGDELTRAKEANLINSLQGKSAGLTITPNTGGAGGASKILLRGNASITGNNSPLIVVDGIPMTNEISGATDVDSGAPLVYGGSGEGGDALSKLNPDDIASITVLKGANSAALYGSAASNGVIMITTKKGVQGTMRINVSSSTTFETPLMMPKFQNSYGGNYNYSGDAYEMSRNSWGKALNQITDEEINKAREKGLYLTRTPYDIADFFKTGTNFNNTVSLSGGTEKMQSYFSYGNTTAHGIYPSNTFGRHNLTLRETFNFFKDKLKIDVSGNYIHQKVTNRFAGGGNMTSSLPSLYVGSRNVDLDWYRKNYQKEGQWQSAPYNVYYPNMDANGQVIPGSFQSKEITSTLKGPIQLWPYSVLAESNNPWWLTNMNSGYGTDNKFMGSIGITYQIIPSLSVQARFKYDRDMSEGESKSYANTRVLKASNDDRGTFGYSSYWQNQIYADGLLSYNKTISDFQIGVNLGASFYDSKGNSHKVTSAATRLRGPYFNTENLETNYFYFDALALGAASGGPTSNWERAIYGTVQLGYKEMINFEASYREDWYRAFTQFRDLGMKPNYGYFSFGGNAILNRLLQISTNHIDMMKLRVSYSEVGNSIPNRLVRNSTVQNANGSVYMKNLDPVGRLKPETTASTEVGLDLTAFNHSFNLDVTYYHAIMSHQFIDAKGTGGKILVMNAGRVRNQGVELTASYKWDIARDFSWKTGINFSYNANKILTGALDKNGQEKVREIKFSGDGAPSGPGLQLKFKAGGSYGDIYVNDFRRNNDGTIRVDPDGNPMYDVSKWDNKIGNMNSKINLGWNNTFTYKDLSLYFLIDGRIGGKVISFTEAFLDKTGQSKRSGIARDKAINNNLYYNGDKSNPAMYITNEGKEQLVSVQGYYAAIGGNCGEDYIYDATSFRMREISLGYTFHNLFGDQKHLTVSATGRNLFFIYKNSPVDPDTSISTSNALGGVDIFSLPTTRSFGVSLKAIF